MLLVSYFCLMMAAYDVLTCHFHQTLTNIFLAHQVDCSTAKDLFVRRVILKETGGYGVGASGVAEKQEACLLWLVSHK